MFSNATIERTKTTVQSPIEQVVTTGLVALAGCSIAAALVMGASISARGTLAAIPASEWQMLLDQRAIPAPRGKACMQHLVGTADAPIGQGWG